MFHAVQTLVVRTAMLLIAILVLASEGASAQLALPPTFSDPYYASHAPIRGAYYDPTQPGAGVLVDIGPDGTMFVGVFHHESDGRASFRTMQGAFTPTYAYPTGTTDLRHRPEPASIGMLRSPLYFTTGGDCLSCPFRATSTVPDAALGIGELVFTESRRARLTVGARVFNLQLLQIDAEDSDLVVGNWLLAAWEGPGAADALASVEIKPIPSEHVTSQAFGFNNRDTEHPLPSPAAKWYSVTCNERCAGFDTWRQTPAIFLPSGSMEPTEVFVWYEPSTGQAVLDQFVRDSSGLRARTGRRAYSLSLDMNLLLGRASYRDRPVFINTNGVGPQEGLLVQLTRLPAGHTLCSGAATCQ